MPAVTKVTTIVAVAVIVIVNLVLMSFSLHAVVLFNLG